MLDHGHAAELGESGLEIVKAQGIRPVVFVRSTKNLEDFENLVDLRVTHEEWAALNHLCKDAASRPQVDSKGVGFLAEQNFWATVPKCHDLVRIRFDGEAEGTCETKISELDHGALCVYQQVLGLEITVENSVLMQVDECLQDLIEERLGLFLGQWLVSVLLHVLFQVKLQVLEDEEELVLRVNDLFEPS